MLENNELQQSITAVPLWFQPARPCCKTLRDLGLWLYKIIIYNVYYKMFKFKLFIKINIKKTLNKKINIK